MLRILNGYKAWIATPGRARSGEVDFGVNWTLAGQRWPRWRVSWIEATGELYARELAPNSDRYAILGHFPTRADVERFMDGWAEGPHVLDRFGDGRPFTETIDMTLAPGSALP